MNQNQYEETCEREAHPLALKPHTWKRFTRATSQTHLRIRAQRLTGGARREGLGQSKTGIGWTELVSPDHLHDHDNKLILY